MPYDIPDVDSLQGVVVDEALCAVDKGPVVCNFPVEDIPGGGQRIGFEVRPVNSFGRFGTPIAARYKAT